MPVSDLRIMLASHSRASVNFGNNFGGNSDWAFTYYGPEVIRFLTIYRIVKHITEFINVDL